MSSSSPSTTSATSCEPNFVRFLSSLAAGLLIRSLRRHEAGPGVIGPGCTPGEGTGCTKMVTPHLDALASESTLFMKNYVQQAVCSPTRTSLLTGRRPDTTHVYDLYSYYRDVSGNFTSLPEFFRLQGYHTVGCAAFICLSCLLLLRLRLRLLLLLLLCSSLKTPMPAQDGQNLRAWQQLHFPGFGKVLTS